MDTCGYTYESSNPDWIVILEELGFKPMQQSDDSSEEITTENYGEFF